MRRRVNPLITSIGLFFVQFSFSQNGIDPASTRYWGANANLFGKKILPTLGNGFAVCGEATIWSGGNQYNGAFIVQSDSSGQQHWERCFTTFSTDFSFETVVQWSDSTFLAAGKILNPMTNRHGGALIKLDKNGNELWKGSVENGADQLTVIKNVVITSDSSALILGSREVPGEPAFVMMIDSAGAKIWSTDVLDPNGEKIKLEGLTQMDNGDFMISGGVSEGGYWKGLLIRIASNGQLLWSKKFDQANSFFTDAISDGTHLYLRNLNTAAFEIINGVVKCDTAGNLNWSRNAYEQDMYLWGNEGRRTLAFDADSNIVFYYQDPYSSAYLKLDSSGNVVSTIEEMGRSDGFAALSDASVAFLVNGPTFGIKKSSALTLEHFVVTHLPAWQTQGSVCIWENPILLSPIDGNTFSDYPLTTGDSYAIMPALMEFVVWFPTIDPYCVDFLGGVDELQAHSWKLYPNPVETELNATYSEVGTEAVISNAFGGVVKKFQITLDMALDVRELSPGFYFLHIGNSVQSFVKK